MKITFGKLLRVVGRIIVAAPIIIEAVEPVFAKRNKRGRDTPERPSASLPAPPSHYGEIERSS